MVSILNLLLWNAYHVFSAFEPDSWSFLMSKTNPDTSVIANAQKAQQDIKEYLDFLKQTAFTTKIFFFKNRQNHLKNSRF